MKKILVLTSLLAFTTISFATVWDANADFSIDNGNPNGAWSYGSKSLLTLGDSDLIDTYSVKVDNDSFIGWIAEFSNLGAPSVTKNISGEVRTGIEPGELSFHPGSDGQVTTVRWTAPSDGLYSLSALFDEGDGGPVDLYIYWNSTELFQVGGTYQTETFTDTLMLHSGDRLDFMVGAGDDFYCDSTPISIRITGDSSAVPGPMAALPFGLGLVCALRRKKSSK